MFLVDYFLPDTEGLSEALLRRARVASGATLLLVAVGLIFSLNRYLSDGELALRACAKVGVR
jgi:hypothetical protein